jgi:ORF6N domain
MFQLTSQEWEILKSQFVISKQEKRGGTQKLPFVFTEQGLAMLSGVLNSDKAIKVNIGIMRAFVVLRQFALTNENLTQKLKEIETKYDKQFKDVIEAINFLLQKEKQQVLQSARKRIGFKK